MSDRKAAEIAGSAALSKRPTFLGALANAWRSIFDDDIALLSAGVAFYSLLAIFPFLAFLVAMFGLLADPAQVQQQLQNVRDVLPAEAWAAIDAQLRALTSQTSRSLSIASIVTLVLAFTSARLAAYGLIKALNIIYEVKETRGYLRTNWIAFLFTLAAIVLFGLNVAAVAAVPKVLKAAGFPELSHTIIQQARWPVLAVLSALGLAAIYRFGPNRKNAQWRWVSLGSLAATCLWLAGTTAFSWYVNKFNAFDLLYGAFGAVVILLYWFWLTAFAALMGAELDMHFHNAANGRR